MTTTQDLETSTAVAAGLAEDNNTSVTAVSPANVAPGTGLDIAELESYWAYRVALEVLQKNYYFLVPFSLVCNAFCFAVLFKRITSGSAFMLMANIAIWDAATILVKGLQMMVLIHKWDIDDASCTALGFFVDMCPPIAEWLVVLLTVDRVIAVWFPFKYRQLCTIPRALIAYAIVVVMMLCVCVNHFWIFQAVTSPPDHHCMVKPEYAKQTERFWWVYLSVYSFVPIASMILLNVVLIYRVRRSMSTMEKAKKPGGGGKSKKMSTENHVTLMALSVTVSFVVLTGPWCAVNAAEYLVDTKKDPDTYVTFTVTKCVSGRLYDLNHCLNVFFYILSGQRFRSDVLALLACDMHKGKDVRADKRTAGRRPL